MESSRIPLTRVFLVWIIICAMLILPALSAIAALRFPDPDDMLRLVQVRDLLSGQGWFDLHQYRIDGPDGTLMHWSRLVDAPLALIILLLKPIIGLVAAEHVAVVIVPLLTLGFIMLAVAKVAARFMDSTAVTFVCICAGLSTLLVGQVQPMRIDHHGWQIFTVVLALVGMLSVRKIGNGIPTGPMLAGAALALGLSISLEILPIAAAFGAVFALRWLIDAESRWHLPAFLGALSAMLGSVFLATRGLTDLAEHCDAISPGHIAAFAVMALGAGGVAWIRPQSRIVVIGLLALPVAAGAALYLGFAPHCAAGPFGNLDPLVRDLWYEKVAEGRPAWRVANSLWIPVALQGLFALGVLEWLRKSATGAERSWWFEYLLVLGAAFLTGLLVWRSMAFVGALSAVPLGYAAARFFQEFRTGLNCLRRCLAAVALIVVLVPAFPISTAKAILPAEVEPKSESKPAASDCRLAESAEALNTLPPGKIFAPLDLGAPVLLYSRHGVVASAHHRAVDAMHDVIAAFTSSPDQARDIVMRNNAAYVLLCEDAGEVTVYRKYAPGGFADQLASGNAPDWLEPVAINAPDTVRLWKVKAGAVSAAD